MRYDEKTEIESTREWMLRFHEAEVSEELMYIPSELWKLGVAPQDVVDRLDWLREIKNHGTNESDHDTIEVEEPPSEEEPVEEPEDVVPVEVVEVSTEGLSLLALYDSYGAWEWAEPVEKMIEHSIAAVFDLEPGLPDFNGLAILTRSRKRARGKKARVARTRSVSESK